VAPTKPEKPIYDEQADAKQQIAAALEKARKENRRVLIQWGGNWCGWCVKLHNLYNSDKDIKTKLLYEYEVVYIDTGKPAGKNVELAKSYGADLEKHGFPYLTVLDAAGKMLANQETGSLENKDQKANPGHDPRWCSRSSQRTRPRISMPRKVLEAGLADASQSGKRVFLHFGAPWCGWCRKLEAWMDQDQVKSVLAKDFVDSEDRHGAHDRRRGHPHQVPQVRQGRHSVVRFSGLARKTID
jgi:thiol-disulfide isomerase/thioredoxin